MQSLPEHTPDGSLTASDMILILCVVSLHIFIVCLAHELWHRSGEIVIESELGQAGRRVCEGYVIEWLAATESGELLPGYTDIECEAPPSYADAVGCDLEVFVVETDED